MSYDDWKLATPEDDEEDRKRFMRKLFGRRPYWAYDRQEVLEDYYEAEKADADMDREDDDE